MKTIFAIVKSNPFVLYIIMTILGVAAGYSHLQSLQVLGQAIAYIFTNIFKCLSIPIIALSIIVTLSTHVSDAMNQLLRRTALYTLTTTIIAASVSCLLYLIIRPENMDSTTLVNNAVNNSNYFHYLANIIPSNFLSPFIENKVISVLLIGIVVGAAIRFIPDDNTRDTITHFFKGLHAILFIITRWVVAILPIGLFGFICTTVAQIENGTSMQGIGEYLAIIVLANLIQGFVILPIWLKLNNISPLQTMRNMMPALSLAFFSKSSAGTLPVTIETAEKNLNVSPNISRFVLPLCTTINMNGCAAFIFTTVIYLMQNNGIAVSLQSMGIWIIIATIAAIGNAGVPMGCFFLSASLLASMNVPITLMGIILPFYGAIDMIETTLNVWSDSCVTKVIDQRVRLAEKIDWATAKETA